MLVILPTAFTLTSVFFGLLSIVWAATQPHWAAVAIVFAGLCDGLDGRVARLTKTESDFGVQLDSLADVLSFGLAPAYLIYMWALQGMMYGAIDGGLIIAFVFLACGILRLARFNVMAADPESTKEFLGLPIPLAACMLAGIVMASHELGAPGMSRVVIIVPVTLALSLLMVSNVRFNSFKKGGSRRRQVAFAAALLFALGLLIAFTTVGVMLITVVSVYILSGIIPAAYRLTHRN